MFHRVIKTSALASQQIRFFARVRPKWQLPTPRTEKNVQVVLLGPPNSGKSTILNALVREKIAATTRKRHTTRLNITGASNNRNVQVLVNDTPGFLASHRDMTGDNKVLTGMTRKAAKGTDLAILVVDGSHEGALSHNKSATFCELTCIALAGARKGVVLVINKVDKVHPKSKLLDKVHDYVSMINGVRLGAERANEARLDTPTFLISALYDDGIDDLRHYLISQSEPKPWILPKEHGVTDLDTEERVEQIVLEALMNNIHEEIPYEATIDCTGYNDYGHAMRFEVDVFVDTTGQRKIIIGEKGKSLVRIRNEACKHLEGIFKKKVITIVD